MFLAALLSSLIGIVLGLLGGGGAILTLPMLVDVLGVQAKPAITMSLFVVGATAFASVAPHLKAGRVRLGVGATFGVAGMAGAFVGSRISRLFEGKTLLVMFGVVMVATAIAMLRGKKNVTKSATPSLFRALSVGAAVGLVAGLVGAGGGFLIVPALVIFGGLDMSEAVGTSLLVLTLQSFSGFVGHLGETPINWTLTLVVAAFAVVGGLLGARLSGKVPADRLRRVFGWFVLAIGALQVAKLAFS
jgi:hypothetical protein